MGRIRRISTDFLLKNGRYPKKIKKNPLKSAKSAPSVLPLTPKLFTAAKPSAFHSAPTKPSI